MARTPQTPRQRVLSRLGKLLASAEDKDNLHEAAVARERAEALIAQHHVTDAELQALALKRRGKIKADAGPCDTAWAEALAFAVGKATECKSLKRKAARGKREHCAIFDGYRADEAAVLYKRVREEIARRAPLAFAHYGYAHIQPFAPLWDAIFGGEAVRAFMDAEGRVSPAALHSVTNEDVNAAIEAAQRVVQHPGSIVRLFVQFANEAGHALGRELVLAPAPPTPAPPAPPARPATVKTLFTITPGFVTVSRGEPGNYATLFCADIKDAEGLSRSRHFRGDLSAFNDDLREYAWVFECVPAPGQVLVFATTTADAVGQARAKAIVSTTWAAHVERTAEGIPVRVVAIDEREEYVGTLLSLAVA